MEVGPEVLGRNAPNSKCYLRDTDIVRASERQHPVQCSGSDGNLGHLGLVGVRSKRVADYALVSADGRLDLGPQIVAAGFLPGHAAAFGDHPKMTVTLCRGGPGRRTLHRACPRRHDDGGIWITLVDRLADLVLIVGAVGSEESDGIDDLVEQSVSRRGIVDILPGHRDGGDLTAVGIDADMQLAPRSAAGGSVLFNQPFAGSAELQTSNQLIARNYYRPSDPAVAKQYSEPYPTLNLVTIKDFGGWDAAQARYFAEGGLFDRIYTAGK
jgi:hypothetical protein